jgi:hypothetical protein
LGSRLTSRLAHEAGPARVSVRLLLLARACDAVALAAEFACPVSPVHRRRSPHGARWPLRPRSSSPASRHPVRAHSLFLPFLSSPAARVEPAHRLRPWPSTRHRRHCCSDHRIAPSTPPSCPELRLSLAQPVLTPVARGKHHLHVNRSSEFRSCSSE